MKRETLIVSSAALLLAASPLLADVREGLVAYWPLDTATGDYPATTPDVVGGNDMMGPNKAASTDVVAGKFNNCVQFYGGDYLAFTNSPGSDTGLPVANDGSWTYCLWVKGDSNNVTTDQTTYFCETSSQNGGGNPRFAMDIRTSTPNKTRYFIRDINNSVKNQTVGTAATLDNTWHHVAFTYDANTGEFTVYVDGQIDDGPDTFTYPQNISTWDQVAIGALVRTSVYGPFNGLIDDVALWARALSQAEVQEVMSNSIATPVPQFAPVVSVNPKGATGLIVGDDYTLSASVYGSRPMYYQWMKDGTNVPFATTTVLALTSVTPNDSGLYQLIATNSSGSITSTVAQVIVSDFASPDLTNGILAYWPCDSIDGVKTKDLVSGYDMTVYNMDSSDVVAGKWGNALSFNSTNSQFARVIYNPGDSLPAYSLSNFTVAFWAKAPVNAAGGWAFAESSTLGNSPAFCMGIKDGSGLNPGFNTFVRNDFGQPSGTHRNDPNVTFWDDTWHHAVWVQHDAGGTPVAEVYVDGVKDTGLVPNPVYPVTPNNTALGAFARATPGQFFNGLVDEVVIWGRPLSPTEIGMLQTGYITNPPVLLSPLAVGSFESDLKAVANGDSTELRWDVPANADTVSISPLGDVTGLTVSGVGSTNVTPSQTTTYVLTVERTTVGLGYEVATASNTIGVVNGIATNWTLLDNFDFYQPGLLAGQGPWVDMYGNSVEVVTDSCNRMLKTLFTASGAYLQLNALTVQSNQSATLFFRMIPQGNPSAVLRHVVGITDKKAQFYYQIQAGGNGAGPMVEPTVNDSSQNPGDWLLAAVNIPYSPLTFDTNVLQAGAVYSVWIDVTNAFIGDRVFPDNYDLFTVYMQQEGDVGRTTVFTNFVSDRDLLISDPLTGGYPSDDLGRIYVGGNSDTDSALFDDFYLSKGGYNPTIPRAVGYAGPPPNLQLQWNGTKWEVVFEGILEEATSVGGTWTEVTGAASPYPITTTGTMKLYRAVCY